MMDLRLNGSIKWFKKEKGYGYIIGEDDETYFFNLLNCVNHSEVFNTGDKVVFEPVFGDMDTATRVEKVSSNG